MPELPEVEVVRRDLEHQVVGRRLRRVEVHGARSVRRHGAAGLPTARLRGRTVTAVDRRGKYLLLRLDDPTVVVVHLGMSGQLRWAASARERRPPHTHVVWTFEGGGQLRFVDPRTFGEVFVSAADPATGAVPELAHLGADPLEVAERPGALAALLDARRTKLKPLLMDQRVLAGIGNIYSDEILFAAGLRGDRPAASLTPAEVGRLAAAAAAVLRAAVAHRGSSLADAQYVDLAGRPGRYRDCHAVYDREGAPCPRCGRRVVRQRWSGRSTFGCPGCQR